MLLLLLMLLLMLLLLLMVLLLLQVLWVLVDPLRAEVWQEVMLRTATNNLLRTPSCRSCWNSCLARLPRLHKLLQLLALLLLLDGQTLRTTWRRAVSEKQLLPKLHKFRLLLSNPSTQLCMLRLKLKLQRLLGRSKSPTRTWLRNVGWSN